MKLNKLLSIRSGLAVAIAMAIAAAAVAEKGSEPRTQKEYRLSAETQEKLIAEMIWVEGGSFTMGSIRIINGLSRVTGRPGNGHRI